MKDKTLAASHGIPDAFVTQFGSAIKGFLCGFDRLRFRATQRLLFQPNSMECYLARCKVLIKNFKSFAEGITERVKASAYQAAAQAGRPLPLLPTSRFWPDACAGADLVSVHGGRVPQWTGVAGATDGPSWPEVRATG
jgi:hypothetical protein